MAMTSFLALTSSTMFIIVTLLHLFSPTSCLNHKQPPPDTIKGLLVEEKTRLGSRPPSCHNKCNNCHPCMAVQVPTSHNRVQQGVTRATTMDNDFDSSSPYSSIGNRYSNYKPLGWKCRCGGHFYNP